MTWSYSTALALTKDQVRLLIGDTDTADQQLQDEEITFLAGQEPGIYHAAAASARTIAAKYARKVDRSVGDLHMALQEKYEHYLGLAEELRMRAAISSVSVYAGGISAADKLATSQDTDRVAPAFRVGLQNYPGSSEPDDPQLTVAQ